MENWHTWVIPLAVIITSVIVARWRANRQVVGLALGVFDFCHEGHVKLLRRAAEQCDRLVVAVHTDKSVRQYKGIQPANSERERAATVEALGIAHKVIISSDRGNICRSNRIRKIFHGDDWSVAKYISHWGEELLEDLGIEIVILPHTPGINSTELRAKTPKIGWWLYSANATWSRSHIFSHLRGLYDSLGGIWFLARNGRDVVRENFPNAPCVFLESGQESAIATESVHHHNLDVIITAHFNYAGMTSVLSKLEKPISLVILSHGRSGKKGTSADVAVKRAGDQNPVQNPIGKRVEKIGNLTIHDWSFAPDSYLHLDPFLSSGGSFINSVPAGKPKILILPTWSSEVEKDGLILASRWHKALRDLGRDFDLLLSPHPLAPSKILNRFANKTGATVLPAGGHSHVHVPKAQCTICDLSGAFWEALLFDTPAILAQANEAKTWSDDLKPAKNQLKETVPECTPENLEETVRALMGARISAQNILAEERLGRVDGKATERLHHDVSALLTCRNDDYNYHIPLKCIVT